MSTQSSTLIKQGPCPHCRSSDAYSYYSDGHRYCFSCEKVDLPIDKEHRKEDHSLHKYRELSPREYRGISPSTFNTMKFKFIGDEGGDDDTPIALEEYYDKDHSLLRNLRSGKPKYLPHKNGGRIHEVLGGREFFDNSGAKYITVCEGAIDGLSMIEAFENKYPVVWVQSASSKKVLTTDNFNFLNKFERIVLAFDNDEPGSKLKELFTKAFSPSKVRVMTFGQWKDVNDLLVNEGPSAVVSAWWGAKTYTPDYLYSSNDEFRSILSTSTSETIYPTPFPSFNEVVRGLVTGHMYLIKGDEGIGKTEFLRALAYHVAKEHRQPIATIFLEESTKRTLQGFITYEAGFPVHFPDAPITVDQEIEILETKVNNPEGLINVYDVKDLDNPDTIIQHISYLTQVLGCKFIFLDPVQQVLAFSSNDKDERLALDSLATKLGKLAVDTDSCIVISSHVNDEGKTRSSRMLAKSASIVCNISRDITNKDPDIRNTSELVVVKNRPFSRTGPAGLIYFDIDTFQLSEVDDTWGQENQQDTQF